MGRGRYPARLKVQPPPAEQAHLLLQWPSRELYNRPDDVPLLTAEALFGRSAELTVELGCATGDELLSLAAADRQACFVGVDVVVKPLYRAVERTIDAQLDNLRWLQADARLVGLRIPDRSVRRLLLHFPPPLLRPRQRGQLLVAPWLLELAERVLRDDGELSFLTDQPELLAVMDEALGAVPQLSGSAVSVDAADAASHYHRRWLARGRPIGGRRIVRRV